MFVAFGSPSDRTDWVHVDNVAHAVHLAADALASRASTVAGQAFFVGDGQPCNTIAMCEPLAEMVGVLRVPGWIPHRVMYLVGWLCELVCKAVLRVTGASWEPFLTRAEVDKVARTHWWRDDRIGPLLGYRPRVSRPEGLRRMVSIVRCAALRVTHSALTVLGI